MSDGPSLLAKSYWKQREAMCLAELTRALTLLRMQENVPESEIDLNRRLYFHLLVAHRQLHPHDPLGPSLECNNQPDPDDEARVKREEKRPDIQWNFVDNYEPDPMRSSRQFVVECKRLGRPTSSNWILNANYVMHGVCRFRDALHAYAQRFPSGAMVGYWQNMEPDELLGDVNSVAQKESIPNLVSIDPLVSAGVSQLYHEFERPFEVSPFRLNHLWIDLRSSS